MAKLILLSILAATVVVPSLAARETNAARGIKKLLVRMFAFGIFYWVAVMFLTPLG